MAISEIDSKRIGQLANEGKQTSRIQRDYFPDYSYSEIVTEVERWGEKSAQGRMRVITTRLAEIARTDDPSKRAEMTKEVQQLAKKMYENYRSSHRKLTAIREALNS